MVYSVETVTEAFGALFYFYFYFFNFVFFFFFFSSCLSFVVLRKTVRLIFFFNLFYITIIINQCKS